MDRQHGSSRKFLIKQLILLIITIVLAVFCTIPLLRTIDSVINYRELYARAGRVNSETETLQKEIDAAGAMRLMGQQENIDDEAQEKLKKKIDELQKQMDLKDKENKRLQEQVAMVQTMLHVMNAKSGPPVNPTVDVSQRILELVTKILGCVGSIFSGGMFLLTWWRGRKKAPKNTAA